MTFLTQEDYPAEFAMHQKYAVSKQLLNLVWTHSVIVADIVQQLLQKKNQFLIYPPLAVQAALMHEIGIYVCGGFDWINDQPFFERPYAHHTVVGAWILWSEKFAPEIVQSAFCHAGMGLSSEDICQYCIDLPVGEYEPTTALQQLVSYAAKFHSKTPKFRTSEDIIISLKKYGDAKTDFFIELQQTYGEPNLAPLIEKYREWHESFRYESNLQNNPGMTILNSAGISSRQKT